MAFKVKKQKMPEGWVRVTWKDSNGKVWKGNIPISSYGYYQLNVIKSGGVVTKTEF